MFLIGSLFFVRPKKSEVEKRELTKFPKITLSSFMDGNYFSEISLWYSDTFPMRDVFIKSNNNFKRLYGVESNTMMVGSGGVQDDIPTEKENSDSNKTKEVVVPDQKTMDAEVQGQVMQSLYIEDGAAYGQYYFNQEAADTYINALNNAAKELKETTKVWSLLVPQNSGALLSDATLEKLGGSDQGQAIEYYFNSYKNVEPIPVYDTLRKHRDEYLYFRTDHHWTMDGAYYAYKNFCKEKGFEAEKLSDFKKMEFSPFLGTYYNELHLAEMEKNPDTVYAYVPNATNDMVYEENGQKADWKIIQDVSDWDSSSGYYCFVAGDRQFAEIDNPKIADGSSVLVIKESYGNTFIPFLVDHYDKVYYMDFRYTPYNVIDFCKEHKVTDLIIENNIQIAASTDVANKINDLLSEKKED